MTNIRVDRADALRTPCGMNSLLYLGDSMRQARRVFYASNMGRDSWNRENASYGVILSVWDSSRRDYAVKLSKGIK